MERTLSVVVGQGSLSHNSRKFLAENIDRSRVADNICYVHQKLEDVYLKLFEESRQQYNTKQKRKDRQIENYMEHVRMQKDKNLFYEVVFQVGDHADMNVKSKDGKLAEKILDQYMKSFTERNPTLYVFSAHLHMDESTPHLHIDYVPFTNGHKRSLETQTTLKGALAKLGFTGGTRVIQSRLNGKMQRKKSLQKLCLSMALRG